MTLDECVIECLQEGSFDGAKLPEDKIPICDDNGDCVGFYTPRIRKGHVCIGFIFIAYKFRRKGHAEMVVRQFLRDNHGLSWFAEIHNYQSQNLAVKIGLKLIGIRQTKRRTYLVYKDEYTNN